MDKCKTSPFCVGCGFMVAVIVSLLIYIVLLLGKSEDDQTGRNVFFVIVGIVVGLLTGLTLVAIIQKLLCCRGNSERTIYKLPLPWNKGQNKLLRTKDFSKSDCCICLEGKGSDLQPVVRTMCNHEFHEKCITKSFSKDERCPKCRQVPGSYSSTKRFKAYLQSVFIKNDANTTNNRNSDGLPKNDGSGVV